MAAGQGAKQCTIILHDDRISTKSVLSGSRVTRFGEIAYLSAPGARTLCVTPAGTTSTADEISIHVTLAQRFGFGNRIVGAIQIVDDVETATANHVELFFKDQHLSRADMWQLMSCVDESVLFKGQTLSYLGSATAEVQHIYIGGNEVNSAYVVHPQTKPIFRSGTSRYTVLIEVSKEMLESWVEGELMYERLINGFLPDLFRRWDVLKVRHTVSIVLFGRANAVPSAFGAQNGSKASKDFFWVLHSQVVSTSWPKILRRLKQVFNDPRLPRNVDLAFNANVPEAIHLAALDFSHDQENVRSMSFGTSIIAITAGAGLFKTSYSLLKDTTDLLVGNSIGVDIVALSPKPLHPAPLFQYEHRSRIEFALPHWVDISFWKRPTDATSTHWILPDAVEPVLEIALPYLTTAHDNAGAIEGFDDTVFKTGLLVAGEATHKNRELISETASDLAVQATKPVTPARMTSDHMLPPLMRLKSEAESTTAKHNRRSSTASPASRKISLGPKGLALSRGVASTTISAAYAQHDREVAQPTPAGGIAKAIRASLARKPSQQSMISHISEPDQSLASKPIDIHTGHPDAAHIPGDPASIIEQKLADSMIATNLHDNMDVPQIVEISAGMSEQVELELHSERLDMLSPWVTLLNPCNPRRDNMKIASQYRKWQHVFPRAISSGAFKWASMCSPAALPITTEYHPTTDELDVFYTQKVRRHVISHSSGLRDETTRALMERLISIRLTRGFQMVAIADTGSDQTFHNRDRPVLLAFGRIYHELQRVSDFEVQVVQYEPSAEKTGPGDAAITIPLYEPSIRMSNGVMTHPEIIYSPGALPVDWTKLDEHILGLSSLPDTSIVAKLRLVLIPAELGKDRGDQVRAKELSDEESRIEGIQKLTQMWQRHRFFSATDKQHQVSLGKEKAGSVVLEKDTNPLAIDYQTRDPSLLINAHGPMLPTQPDEYPTSISLFADSEKHHSGEFDMNKLIKQMQEPPPYGVVVRDRRWLTQTHVKCFRGDEMTTWLLGAFKNLDSRDDAVAVGNELMNRGVFAHVRGKHRFRDGHYFYQISPAHRTTDYPDSTSFFSKAAWRSVPATPMAESITSPLARPTAGDLPGSVRATPLLGPVEHKHLLLSQVLQYNVDAGKKSDHLHIVNLHYDRIHHPDNCYHIQLEWLGASAKLIKESINRWHALVEPHGLKLLQLPMVEAFAFQVKHSWDQPQSVKLAMRPSSKALVTPLLEPHTSSPRRVEDRAAPYKAILRTNDFVLDYEAASAFSSKLHVTYSWGPPNFEYTQFVHRSGLVIAQILLDTSADFLLLPNPLASSRVSMSTKQNQDPEVTADGIMASFKAFCNDVEALRQCYAEMHSTPRMYTPSPLGGDASAADIDVPPMQLPPHLIQRSQGQTPGPKP